LKKLRFLALAIAGLTLSLSVNATMIQSDGVLTVSSKVFIDSHFEFTEENSWTLESENKTIFTAVTLAQIRSLDLSINDNSKELSAQSSVAKSLPIKHVEVGWQNSNTYK
jgi:hypothetical protein